MINEQLGIRHLWRHLSLLQVGKPYFNLVKKRKQAWKLVYFINGVHDLIELSLPLINTAESTCISQSTANHC